VTSSACLLRAHGELIFATLPERNAVESRRLAVPTIAYLMAAQPGHQARAPTAIPSVGNLIRHDESWTRALQAVSNATGKPIAVLLNRPAHPRDVSAYLEALKEARKQSRFSRTCRAVTACIDAIRRHDKALDMFAQAGGMSGCLIWGCIKLALEVSQLARHSPNRSNKGCLGSCHMAIPKTLSGWSAP